jgi:hypothetical protein
LYQRIESKHYTLKKEVDKGGNIIVHRQGRAERFARGRLTTIMKNFQGRALLLQTKSLEGGGPLPTLTPPSTRSWTQVLRGGMGHFK